MSESKIVAECLTCAYLRGEWAAWSHGSISNPPDGGIPIDNDRTPTLEIHRAAGHDVRPAATPTAILESAFAEEEQVFDAIADEENA